MITKVKGNIVDAKQRIIVQQVNCSAKMGSGLARSLYEKFPNVRTRYMEFCKNQYALDYAPEGLLGFTQFVKVGPGKYVANIFGQVDVRKGVRDTKVYTVYSALEEGFEKVKKEAINRNLSVAIPYRIGCGLANGSWDTVEEIIYRVFDDERLRVYIYELTS